jgi:hypothetical protein
LIVIAHLKSSKDKGKGRAPSNLVDRIEDGIVPDPEASLEYDEAVTPEGESDDGDSDFEASEPDSEDEDNRNITFRMFAAATEASIRDMMSGGASTSAGSSGSNILRHTELATATGYYFVDSEVVPDSDPEAELLVATYPEDEFAVQRGMNLGKGRGKNKVHGKINSDAGDIHHDVFSARREARRRSRLDKQEIRLLEYQLGRRLTYVGLTISFYAFIYAFKFLTWF